MVHSKPEIQTIELLPGRTVQVLRLDTIDVHISGNKWYKLKYNIVRAQQEAYAGLLTFGGANSNHLAATAAACKRVGLRSAGIIRATHGEAETPTLKFAREQGMDLHYVARAGYELRSSEEQLREWQDKFPDLFMVPEGGANAEGVKGAAEIIENLSAVDYCCCACGTGTTFRGLVQTGIAKNVLGFSVLKGENTLPDELHQRHPSASLFYGGNEIFEADQIQGNGITNRFATKGYAGYFQPAFEFSKDLYARTGLLLDHVYTARLFYGLAELMKENRIPSQSSILLIHSGGLQGNVAFEARYGLKAFKD